MSETGEGNRRKIVLDVSDLEVKFFQDVGTVNAVNDVSLCIHEGQSVGIVGESGCGKSVTSYSILRLLPNNAKITKGTVLYTPANGNTIDLTQGDPDGELIRSVRGKEIAMIFQEPMSALSPVHTIYDQMS
ncbi:MAG: ABC transporter ATP-binding protein, partial [Spirochaetaceae bacterium]